VLFQKNNGKNENNKIITTNSTMNKRYFYQFLKSLNYTWKNMSLCLYEIIKVLKLKIKTFVSSANKVPTMETGNPMKQITVGISIISTETNSEVNQTL